MKGERTMNPTRMLAKQMVDLAKQHPATGNDSPSPALAFLQWAVDNIKPEAPDGAEAFAQLLRDELPIKPAPIEPPTE